MINKIVNQQDCKSTRLEINKIGNQQDWKSTRLLDQQLELYLLCG